MLSRLTSRGLGVALVDVLPVALIHQVASCQEVRLEIPLEHELHDGLPTKDGAKAALDGLPVDDHSVARDLPLVKGEEGGGRGRHKSKGFIRFSACRITTPYRRLKALHTLWTALTRPRSKKVGATLMSGTILYGP